MRVQRGSLCEHWEVMMKLSSIWQPPVKEFIAFISSVSLLHTLSGTPWKVILSRPKTELGSTAKILRSDSVKDRLTILGAFILSLKHLGHHSLKSTLKLTIAFTYILPEFTVGFGTQILPRTPSLSGVLTPKSCMHKQLPNRKETTILLTTSELELMTQTSKSGDCSSSS